MKLIVVLALIMAFFASSALAGFKNGKPQSL